MCKHSASLVGNTSKTFSKTSGQVRQAASLRRCLKPKETEGMHAREITDTKQKRQRKAESEAGRTQSVFGSVLSFTSVFRCTREMCVIASQ